MSKFLKIFLGLIVVSIGMLNSSCISKGKKYTLWPKTYGGSGSDAGYSVQECKSGGFIIAGYTGFFALGPGSADVYLIRTDADGNPIWAKTYEGTDYAKGYSVQECKSGGFIIVGYTGSFETGCNDVYLIRTDENGDAIWTKTYEGYNEGRSVQECSSGGFVITGETQSFGAGKTDVYLIRTDENGDTLWAKTYGGTDWDGGYSVQECSSGGFIIGGYTYSYGAGNEDVYLIRTDGNGDTIWTKTYGESSDEAGFSVQECLSGGFIIAGATRSFGAGGADVYLIRTDENGDTLWTKTYGGTDWDKGYSVQECKTGGFIITGRTISYGAGDYDVYLIRTDANGNTLWTKTYGGGFGDYGYSVQECSDGGFIIAGETYSYGAGYYSDAYLIRTDENGEIFSTQP